MGSSHSSQVLCDMQASCSSLGTRWTRSRPASGTLAWTRRAPCSLMCAWICRWVFSPLMLRRCVPRGMRQQTGARILPALTILPEAQH